MITTRQLMDGNAIKRAAPSVFAKAPVDEVSKHYTFIPTIQLIDDFKKLGWEVYHARQQKSRVKPIHTKHLVIFRSADTPAINGLTPELVMVNSHDRTTSFNFMLGLFREINLSGLIVSDKMFESLKIRHMGYDFEDLKDLANAIIENMPHITKAVLRMQQIGLDYDQQEEFAMNAIAARFNEYITDKGKVNTKAIRKAIDIAAFLTPTRLEDGVDDQSIWAVYTRIQEKLLKGGFQRIGMKDNRSKSVRDVTNIKLDVELNRELWSLAQAYTQ